MAKKDNTPELGGFDILANSIFAQPGQDMNKGVNSIIDDDDEDGGDDTSLSDKEKNKAKDIPGVKSVDPDFFTRDEDEDDEDESDDTDDGNDDSKDTDDVDLEFEGNITTFMKEKLSDSLGWDFSKMEEEPKTIEDIVSFLKEVVEENSVPSYANKEVEEYDKFVRNGGNLRDFYASTIEGRIDTDSIDINDPTDQKRVIRQHLKNQGISDKIIEKRLTRYDEAGVLEEEAEEAFELVKEYDTKVRQKLLETQQKQAADIQKQQQKFVEDVEKGIKDLSVRGFTLTDKEKKELREYILVTDADGLTGLQRDYDIKTLLESAYFIKNKDVLLDRAKKQGASNSLRDLQKKLNQNKGNNKSKGSGSNDDTSFGIGDLGGRLGLHV